MLRKSLLCAASLLFAGCDKPETNDAETFRDGLPSKEMMQVKAPKAERPGAHGERPVRDVRPGPEGRVLPGDGGGHGRGERRHAVGASLIER